jgi:hypothetical protein
MGGGKINGVGHSYVYRVLFFCNRDSQVSSVHPLIYSDWHLRINIMDIADEEKQKNKAAVCRLLILKPTKKISAALLIKKASRTRLWLRRAHNLSWGLFSFLYPPLICYTELLDFNFKNGYTKSFSYQTLR